MIKLFNRDETNFEHNETILRNVISTSVEEESNGLYELVLEHPRDEIGNQLTNGKIIKAPTPRGDQLFRIYKPIKNLKTYTIYARHIFYDLLNNFIESAKPTNADGNAAIQRILDRLQFSQRFIGSSDIADYSEAYYVRMNPVQALIGADNSFINVWGGELIRDNFTFRINVRGGFDTGYEIRTGKNLTGAEIELDESGVYTRIYPSVVIEDNVVTTLPEEYIDSPLILNYESPRIIEERIELTDEQKELPLSEIYNLMRNHCSDLFEKGLDKPSVNYKVDFVELRKTAQYAEFEILETVNLYDDVRIYIKELNIDIVARVIKIEYDSLKEQYNKIELGNFKNSLSSQLGKVDVVAKQINNELDRIENIAQLAANGKNTIFRGPDEPTIAIKNDLWYKPIGDGEIELYIYDGNSWGEPVISSGINDEFSQAIATQQDALEEVKTTTDYSYDQIQQTIANSGFTDLDTAFANVKTLSEQAESNADEAMQLAIGSDGRLTLAEQFLDGFRNTAFDPTTGQLSLTEQTINGLQETVSDPVNGLETRVTTIADGFNVLSTDFNNLQIGGRNYILNSSNEYTFGGYAHMLDLNEETKFELQNTNVVVSMEAKHNEGSEPVKPHVYFRTSSGSNLGFAYDGEKLTETKYKRFEISIPLEFVPKDMTDYTTLTVRKNDNTNSMSFRNLKLEKGNKATDWTPAPEDMASQAQLAVTNENVLARVQKGDVYSQLLIDSRNILFDANDRFMLSANKVVIDASEGTFITSAIIESLSADKLTAGEIDANVIDVININVDSLVGNQSSFIQSYWNDISSSVQINSDGLITTGTDSKTEIESGYIYNEGQLNGELVQAYITGGSIMLSQGLLESTLSPKSGLLLSSYAEDNAMQIDYSGLRFYNGSQQASLKFNGTNYVLDTNLGLYGNHINSVNWIRLIGDSDYEMTIHKHPTSSGGAIVDSSIITLGIGVRNSFTTVAQFYGNIDFRKNLDMKGNNIGQVNAIGLSTSNTYLASRTSGLRGGILYDSIAINIGTGTEAGVNIHAEFYGQIHFYRNLYMNGRSVLDTSDERKKELINPTKQNSLEMIKALDYKEFYWKDKEISPNKQFGLIAQEIDPTLVHYNKQKDEYGIKQNRLIYTIGHAVQQLALDHENAVSLASKAYLKSESNEERIEKLEAELKLLKGDRE